MAFSTGASHGLSFIAESTFGTPPGSPAMVSLRHTSCSLVLAKDGFQSQELRSDRQISDFRLGAQKVGGEIGIEFSYKEYDPFLESVLYGVWGTQSGSSASVASVSVAAGTGVYTRAAGSFVTDNIAVGDYVTISGCADPANNGIFKVTAVAALTLTTNNTASVVASSQTVTFKSLQTLTTASTRKSFTLERRFVDIAKYGVFAGCIADKFSLSLRPNAITTGSFGITGVSAAYSGTSLKANPTASQTASPYDAFTGTLKEGGTVIGVVTGLDLSIDNGVQPVYAIGSSKAAEVVVGRSNVTGSLSVYFQDQVMLDKFINETESSLEFVLGNGTAQSYFVRIPRIKYSGSDNAVSGEGPIVLNMPWQALYSSTESTNILIAKTQS